MRWNIPNILTLLRLLAAPGVAIMFLFFPRPWADWFALVLFVLAAITDWFDGYLARRWKQETKLGAMLDPIADKAMVVIALCIITGLSSFGREIMDLWILLPATVILFREVFVSGMREYLGDVAGTLKVTNLAKYKTTAQMIAIAILFGKGVFEHHALALMYGLGPEMTERILAGQEVDAVGVGWYISMTNITWWIGVGLLWIAAVLTAITGWDYFKKALPHLKEPV